MAKYTKQRKGGAPPRPQGPRPPRPGEQRLELVVPAGIEPIARAELRRLGRGVRATTVLAPGVIGLRYHEDLRLLLGLRTITSAYLVERFEVPRPRALLGDEQFRGVLAHAQRALRLHPAGAFQSLYLSAAGAESAVLTRLKADLAARLGLGLGEEDGDLLLRLRPAADGEGWELLVRLSPRPLATRPWRVCNMEGALNGAVAHAMALLTRPAPAQVFLNLGCGSGSLLIERLLAGPARRAIGCDTSPDALGCAQSNLAAAGLGGRAELTSWDATALPLPDASVDAICADLPFGHRVGSHEHNLALYPALLAEAARVARPGALAALLSHEVRLMERLITPQSGWALERELRIDLGGLAPRIYLLRRA